MKNTIQNSLKNAISYQVFRDLVATLVSENKSTGLTQTEELSHYSLLNDKRMKRLDKKIILTEETTTLLNNLDEDFIFLVLMESWCGDGAQTLPVINKIASFGSKIELKIVLRDTNDSLMQHFLTNGGKAIPKLLILQKETLKVINSWGPRPQSLTKIVNAYKKEHGSLDAEFKQQIQVWYNKDKGLATQKDITSLLKTTVNVN